MSSGSHGSLIRLVVGWGAGCVHVALVFLLLLLLTRHLLPYYFFFPETTGAPVEAFTPHTAVSRTRAAADALNTEVLWRASAWHLGAALGTFLLVTLVVTPPFGRYAARSRVPLTVPARLSWILQECPTLLNVWFFVTVEYPAARATARQWAPGGMSPSPIEPLAYAGDVWEAVSRLRLSLLLFVIHYLHRSCVYPWALPSQANRVPIHVTWSATLYCLFNGRLQVLAGLRAWSPFDSTAPSTAGRGEEVFLPFVRCLREAPCPTPLSWTSQGGVLPGGLPAWGAAVLLGFGSWLFFRGMSINMEADYALIALRGRRSSYSLPRGGWFDVVSCPNFLGEMVEWTGYVLVTLACSWHTDRTTCGWPPLESDAARRTFPSVSARVWRQGGPTAAACSFLVYVVANLVPRARAHHRWYGEYFGRAYHQLQRRAVIPGLL